MAYGDDDDSSADNDDVMEISSPSSDCSNSNESSAQSLRELDDGKHDMFNNESQSEDIENGTMTPPPLLSSPSIASSLGASSRFIPSQGRLSHTSSFQSQKERSSIPSSSANRFTLALRLTHLAEQLKLDGNDIDEDALNDDVDRMETVFRTVSSPLRSSSVSKPVARLLRSHTDSFTSRRYNPSSHSYQSHHLSCNCNKPDNIYFCAPPLFPLRSRFSDLAASLTERVDGEPAMEPEIPTKVGMTIEHANKVIAEATKLNEDLISAMENLRARQEESDHIHALLIERAERAAQRIIFLQNRITYLQGELDENDGELQHLRICLKAVEVQLPQHPDQDLLHCISIFKEDYQVLKKKRLNRSGSTVNSPFSDTAERTFTTTTLKC